MIFREIKAPPAVRKIRLGFVAENRPERRFVRSINPVFLRFIDREHGTGGDIESSSGKLWVPRVRFESLQGLCADEKRCKLYASRQFSRRERALDGLTVAFDN